MENKIELNKNALPFKKIWLQYTLLYIIFCLTIFSVFILLGKSFMHVGDNFKQGYFWLAEIRNNIKSFFAGNGYAAWTWSKGLGMDFVYHLDIFDLIPMIFPEKLFELGYSIEMLAKLYCGGIAYLLYARDLRHSDFACLMGSLCYVFSTWYLSVMLMQNSFICVIFLMPLLTMSIDWIFRGKTPVLFIVVVAYFLAHDAYVAYMAAIASIIYMLLRYFTYNDKFNFKEYFLTVGRFVIYGIIAAVLACFTLLPELVTLLNASSESASDGIRHIFNPWLLYDFGCMLVGGGFTHGYSYFGLPILALLLLPFAFRKLSLRNTHVIMAIMLLLMTLFPFFGTMFNGFGYRSSRWYFLIVFFMNLAVLQCLDVEEMRKKSNIIRLSIWLAILAIWSIGFDVMGLTHQSLRAKAFILLNLATAVVIILVLAIAPKGEIKLGSKSFTIDRRKREIALICITGLMLTAGWSLSLYLYRDSFISIGEVSERLEKSTQRAAAMLEAEDDSFYRTDQVDWLNFSHDSALPANENLYWGTKTIYGYDSYISAKQLEFSRLTGNSYSYIMRVCSLSNDNRMGLDFLYGVKYFLGDDTKNDRTGSDAYAGYGFGSYKQLDGVNVFKNKYASGLGFGYDAFISEKEFSRLSRLEREQALLQAVVLDTETASTVRKNSAIKELKAEDIELDIDNVPYTITGARNATISEDGKTINVEKNATISEDGSTINVEKNGASITLDIGAVNDSQLMLSFDNLHRVDNGEMDISCWCDGGRKEHLHSWHSNQAISNVCDFDVNLGYYDSFSGTVTIKFATAGEYSFDKLYISAMKSSNYDKFASERIDEKYEITSYDNRHVSGTIDMKEDGIVYLSIPKYSNWKLYVDGTEVEKLENVNIAFLGAELKAGKHKLELKYCNRAMRLGALLSVLGIILTALIGYLHKKRRIEIERA